LRALASGATPEDATVSPAESTTHSDEAMKILLGQVVNAYEKQLSEQKVRARHPS
jgi:hypothetical protein